MSHTTDEKQTLTRRQAIKTLAAVAGAVTLAGLPNNWEKPIVEVGALPAHAQTSATAAIEVVNNTIGTVEAGLLNPGNTDLGSPDSQASINSGSSHRWTGLTPYPEVDLGAQNGVVPSEYYKVTWDQGVPDVAAEFTVQMSMNYTWLPVCRANTLYTITLVDPD